MDEQSLKDRIIQLEKENLKLVAEKAIYEKGDAKLYYAFQRKMTEMANILNKNNLENCDIEDKNSKAFDRIIAILQKCEVISASASALGVLAKVTGDEAKDISKKPFTDRIADDRH